MMKLNLKFSFSIFNTRTLCYFNIHENVFLQNYIRYSSFETIFMIGWNVEYSHKITILSKVIGVFNKI